MESVIISFPIESEWYKKYGSKTYTVLILSQLTNSFTFSLPTNEYKDDELLNNLANSIGTVDCPLVKLSYATDEVYVQFKRPFKPSFIANGNYGKKEITTFVFNYTKN